MSYQDVFTPIFNFLSGIFDLAMNLYISIPWYIPLALGLIVFNMCVYFIFAPAIHGNVSAGIGFLADTPFRSAREAAARERAEERKRYQTARIAYYKSRTKK